MKTKFFLLAIFSTLILAASLSGQSTDRNNPTLVTGNTFSGNAGAEGGTFYYSYVVPKGTLKITITGQTNEYSTPIRLNVYNNNGSDSLGEIYLIADKAPQSLSRSYSFLNKHSVIISVNLNKDSTLKWQKFTVSLGSGPIMIPGKKGLADLTIQTISFNGANDKAVSVAVKNNGSGASGGCTLQLTVRKIKGTAVGRITSVEIPAMSAGQTASFTVDATKILPKNVKLQDTMFKVIVDSAGVVGESNETNNEKWHNLN